MNESDSTDRDGAGDHDPLAGADGAGSAVPPAPPADSLVDGGAAETLRRAAEAVGLPVERLCDLASASGYTDARGGHGLVKETTPESIGLRLWSDALGKSDTELPPWFRGLLPAQRAAVVCVLRSRGKPASTIAQTFDIPTTKVVEIFNEYADQLGRPLVNVRLTTLAGQLQLMAERAQEMASEKKDPGAFWRIAKEFVGSLQSLGIVDQAAQEINVSHEHSLAESQKNEILDRMVELREKEKLRLEEIKQAEVELVNTEPLPIEEDDEEDDDYRM